MQRKRIAERADGPRPEMAPEAGSVEVAEFEILVAPVTVAAATPAIHLFAQTRETFLGAQSTLLTRLWRGPFGNT